MTLTVVWRIWLLIRSQGSEKIEGMGIITDAEESTAQEKRETEDAGHNIDMDM